ncbi:SAV_2336 N-terminal domain-related protein [Streptomyces sp. NPDC026206]|uniref:SAV_2336 N-terminal domain-related protein n=1 Tax=Streptomyces sp. NPDC026206 TaxID=3157089 RepID=UPI0033FC1AA8
MTAPPDQRLGQLVARLQAAEWDLSAEELADALWLAQWAGPGTAAGQARDGEPPAREHPGPTGRTTGSTGSGHPGDGEGRRPGTPDAPRGGTPGEPAPDGSGGRAAVRRAERSGPVSVYAPRGGPAAPADAFPIRVPMASSLPGLLGLQRALRPLRGYRPPARPAPGPLDEEATADCAARTGVLDPVHRPGGRRAASMQLLMDTAPSMAVWERMLEELRQTCAQLGVFRDVQVRYLHRADDGTPLVGTTASPGAPGDPRRLRPRPADQFRDPTGRRLTLVISDCVGPLWQEGRAQRLLHHWALTSPLAVVQPLPPRLWPRTALPADAGLLIRDAGTGGRLRFEPGGYGPLPGPGALPAPVLLPTRDALGAWARLLSGPGRTAVRGAAGWVLPGHPARPVPAPGEHAARGADDLLRSFRAVASPGALRLAVHLAAVPLTLPVMQVVQRAMLPDTGPMELAEVLLSGLLWRLPGTGPGPGTGQWYEFADGVREMLLQSLDQGAAALVLKHCSDYVERHFGKSARNFSALAAAQLSGRPPQGGAGPGGEPDGPVRTEISGPAEPELFAEVPARVVRWYQPVPVESGPVGEAERLLRLWQVQADPTLLHEARAHAGPAATAPLVPGDAAEGIRARLVLGAVLRALAGTESVRADPTRRHTILTEAVALLTEAHDHTEPGSDRHAAAALELAAAHHSRWLAGGGREELLAAERTLRALPPGDPVRHLRLGRVLLTLARSGPESVSRAVEAAAELRTACELLESADAPDVQRCAALLDLARALRHSGAPAAEALAVLGRARAAAADGLQLLHCRTEQARAHAAARSWPEADDAYAAAVSLAGRDSVRRCELLLEWGESLLGRARAVPPTSEGPPGGAGGTDALARAEAVLREAFAVSPGRSPLRSRTQLMLGSALVLRFGRQGFPPDLYESCHLLEGAARHAPDGTVRAEAWLELGTARLALSESPGTVAVADAAAAFDAAAKEAARLPRPDGPGSVTAARALHRHGEALERMGLRRDALAAYRDAQQQWRHLTARLAPVPWAEVAATRESVARLTGA